MKRRDFLKFLGVTASAPVIAKGAEVVDLLPKSELKSGTKVAQSANVVMTNANITISNSLLTPNQITKESLKILNEKMKYI